MTCHRVAVADVGLADVRIELAHRLFHLPAAEGRRQFDGGAFPLHGHGAQGLLRHLADQVLGEVHDLVAADIGLVQLQHRELRVVPGADAFVAEIAVDLVDALEAAHHQALEVELGRHAQVHLHVQRVVVGHERARRGAAGEVVHHRGLDLEEAARVEPAPDRGDDARALDEDLARFGRHHQVDVALAVALLHVGQAMPLVGQRAQRLGQQAQALDLDRQLAGAGAHQGALGADDVAHVPALERLVAVAQRLGLQEQLDAAADVLDLRERGLAHQALGEHAPGQDHAAAAGLERLAGPALGVGVLVLQVLRVVVAPEVVGIGDALPAQRRQLGAALGDEGVLVGRRSLRMDWIGHGVGSIGGRIGNRVLVGIGGCRSGSRASGGPFACAPPPADAGRPDRPGDGCHGPAGRGGDHAASLRLAPASRPDLRLPSTNSSRSPSSTFCVSLRSMPVRRSLMRLWSST